MKRPQADKSEFRVIASLSIFITSLPKWGTIALACRYGYLSIAALSGKNTDANIEIAVTLELLSKLFRTAGVFNLVCIAFGGSGIIYGLIQRHLRAKISEQMGRHTEQCEKRIDPKRSSSGITRKGRTPKTGK